MNIQHENMKKSSNNTKLKANNTCLEKEIEQLESQIDFMKLSKEYSSNKRKTLIKESTNLINKIRYTKFKRDKIN